MFLLCHLTHDIPLHPSQRSTMRTSFIPKWPWGSNASLVICVQFPTSRWMMTLMGNVSNSQFFFGISIPNRRNSFDNNGESSHIPSSDTPRSNRAYPPMRNDRRYSIVTILFFYPTFMIVIPILIFQYREESFFLDQIEA